MSWIYIVQGYFRQPSARATPVNPPHIRFKTEAEARRYCDAHSNCMMFYTWFPVKIGSMPKKGARK